MTNSPGISRLRQFLLAAALLLLICQPAFAEKRVALVIGNSAYQNVARLPNPVNDGATIAATLKDAGFDVVDSRHDLPAADTRRALRDFADRARDADIAVVYYAGHGMEVDGSNYLIPIDARLERDTDVYDETLSLDRILVSVEPARIILWLAHHEGDLVAATIAIRVGTHAWYSYGASSTDKREVRGSNAVQWAMIRDAMARGAEVYDLRGITDTLDADDPHVGLIQFKVGTGGEAIETVGEWDLPLNRALYRGFQLYLDRRSLLPRRGRR